MEILNWGKINNGKDFQRLINDLFALEINSPAFLSSSPEIGKDAGWDTRYKGSFMGRLTQSLLSLRESCINGWTDRKFFEHNVELYLGQLASM